MGRVGTLKSVKGWQFIILIAIGILGFGYIWLHRVELGLVRPASLESESATGGEPGAHIFRPARIAWENVDRSPDGFKVEMPADVRQLQVPAINEQGGVDQINMILSNASAETTFAVAWADDPPVARISDRNAGRILDMARDDAMARTQTSMTTEARNFVSGFPARDFSARNTNGGVMTSRLIYVNQRLYMLIAAFPSDSARREQDVARFFDSFAIVATERIPETLPPAQAAQ
jgi:hypothetical protein